jgi:arylsulfatase A-like enzyme
MSRLRVEPSQQIWFGGARMRGPAFFVRTRGWHYIWYVDRDHEELYDPDTDPRETRNLASEHPAETERFRAALDAWQSEMAAPFSEAARGEEIEYRPHARSTSGAPRSGP